VPDIVHPNDRPPVDSEQRVLSANQKFYDAFNQQDLEGMQQVWVRDPAARCIHPGWPVLRGFDSIIKSWQDIFENTDHMEIKLTDVQVVTTDDLVWVSCQENLFSIHMAGVQTSQVHATNLFQQVSGDWKMILHHAAAIPADPQVDPTSN